MIDLVIPASNALAEEWGRLAVSIPGFRLLPGMCDTVGDRWGKVTLHDGARAVLRATGSPEHYAYEWPDRIPDPDDMATAGLFVKLLSPESFRVTTGVEDNESWAWWSGREWYATETLGRACIAAAAAIGYWPGGEK
jgi:hypothetical protein